MTTATTPKPKAPRGERAAKVLEIIRRWNAEQRHYSYEEVGRELGVAGAVVLQCVYRLCAEGKLVKAMRPALVEGFIEVPQAETKAA